MTSDTSGASRSNADEETWVRRGYRILIHKLNQFLKEREVKNFRTAMKRKIVSFSKPEELSPLQQCFIKPCFCRSADLIEHQNPCSGVLCRSGDTTSQNEATQLLMTQNQCTARAGGCTVRYRNAWQGVASKHLPCRHKALCSRECIHLRYFQSALSSIFSELFKHIIITGFHLVSVVWVLFVFVWHRWSQISTKEGYCLL